MNQDEDGSVTVILSERTKKWIGALISWLVLLATLIIVGGWQMGVLVLGVTAFAVLVILLLSLLD